MTASPPHQIKQLLTTRNTFGKACNQMAILSGSSQKSKTILTGKGILRYVNSNGSPARFSVTTTPPLSSSDQHRPLRQSVRHLLRPSLSSPHITQCHGCHPQRCYTWLPTRTKTCFSIAKDDGFRVYNGNPFSRQFCRGFGLNLRDSDSGNHFSCPWENSRPSEAATTSAAAKSAVITKTTAFAMRVTTRSFGNHPRISVQSFPLAGACFLEH